MVFMPLILVFSTKRIFELSCCECCFIVVLQLYQGSSCILDFGTDVLVSLKQWDDQIVACTK